MGALGARRSRVRLYSHVDDSMCVERLKHPSPPLCRREEGAARPRVHDLAVPADGRGRKDVARLPAVGGLCSRVAGDQEEASP